MQVILCSSLKISITPQRVGQPATQACDVAPCCNPVTAVQQWKPAGAQFEAAATEENGIFLLCSL